VPQAANQGHALAQFTLGLLYTHGNGVIKNDTAAFEWQLKAAEQGHADSVYAHLSRMLRASPLRRPPSRAACAALRGARAPQAWSAAHARGTAHAVTPATPHSVVPGCNQRQGVL